MDKRSVIPFGPVRTFSNYGKYIIICLKLKLAYNLIKITAKYWINISFIEMPRYKPKLK